MVSHIIAEDLRLLRERECLHELAPLVDSCRGGIRWATVLPAGRELVVGIQDMWPDILLEDGEQADAVLNSNM